MSDDNDITRIEDLSEFLHDEEEDLGLDQFNDESDSTDFDLDNDATDPNIELPDEFLVGENAPDEKQEKNENAFETDFGDSDDPFESQEDDSFESNTDFDNEQEDSVFENTNFEENDFDNPDFDSDDFSENENSQDKIEINDQFEEKEEEEVQASSEPEEVQEFSDQLNNDDQAEQISSTKDQEPIQEIIPSPEVKSEIPPGQYQTPESFKELREFANTINYTNAQHEGNPPYSIVLSEIKYSEDIEDILIHLNEFGITKDAATTQAFKESLLRGSCLIPRLSEFAAITLCHKLRRFSLDIKMGLTEQITPPKSYSSNDKGLVSKYSLLNSQSFNYKFEKHELKTEDIITSTLSTIEGMSIIEQVGIVNIQTKIDQSLLESNSSISIDSFEGAINEMKQIAVNKKANAVIGIQYQVLANNKSELASNILITGNLVWLQRK